ncbi:hypothetical protein KC973_00690 [Candidatus Saccharibacteria bacterium]|nr:hypothetical protein [Candidatus Saccharibacteria bacterium]
MTTYPTGNNLPELSAIDVERAHLGECDNLFISILSRHIDVMRDHTPTNTDRADAYVDELIEYSPYELDACTLIAAWAIGLEDPARTGMSRSFSVPLFAVHALYDPSRGGATKDVATGFIQDGTLPDTLFQDDIHLGYAREQMAKVSGEMVRIRTYMDGTPNAMDEVSRLVKSDDPEDKKRLQELLDYAESHKTPLLSAVCENVSNARVALGMQLIK